MTDIPVKPHRKTLQQTALILNVSVKTVRRYLDNGRLIWSGNQVSIESIDIELKTERPKDIEPIENIPEHRPAVGRRIISRGI